MMHGGIDHIIQRQVFETSFPSKSEALKSQNTLPEMFKQVLVPLMANIFDRLVPPDMMYIINKIDLDLGTISWDKFEENFRENLTKKLEEAVITKLHEAKSTHQPQSKSLLSAMSKGEDDKFLSINLQEAKMEAFVYFLKNGHKPWWATNDLLEKEKDALRVLMSCDGNSLRKSLFAMLEIDTVRNRLIRSYSKPDLEELFGIQDLPVWLEKLASDFEKIEKKIGRPIQSRESILKFLWSHFLEFYKDQPQIQDRLIVPSKAAKQLKSQTSKLSKTRFTTTEKSTSVSFLFTVWLGNLINSSKQNFKADQAYLDSVFDLFDSGFDFSSLELKKFVDLNLPKWKSDQIKGLGFLKSTKILISGQPSNGKDNTDPKSARKPLAGQIDKTQVLEVKNAGLVILAPFLPHFFKGLGLVHEKEFVHQEAQYRALSLSQYLIDQENEFEEGDLILNKTLCGFDWSDPVPLTLKPTPEEVEEVEHLLLNVVSSWKALKSTSVDGLRKSFLVRPALIEEKERHFSLKVERITIDVLLDKLPWGISLIKFPWMTKPLYVEW